MNTTGEMPTYFQSTLDMIKRAYPEGLPSEDRDSVIVLLHEQMSIRSISEFMTFVDGSDYYQNYNDVSGALSKRDGPSLEDIERVSFVLREAGYEVWLDEE